MVESEHRPVHAAPDDESPGGPVSKASEQRGYQEIKVAARHATPVASERYVDEIPQQSRQGYMPPAPEIDDGHGFRFWRPL
jgi:hypothetical protein